MHLPFLHWNFPDGHEGLVVVTTRAVVGGSVVDGSARCLFLGSAVESGNIDGSCNNGSYRKRMKVASKLCFLYRTTKCRVFEDNFLGHR